MTVFNCISNQDLDSFIGLVNSYINVKYRPILEKSDTVVLKTISCVRMLVDWHNNLKNCTNDSDCELIFVATALNEFTASKKLLNKTKRKFFKLLLKNLPSTEQARLTTHFASKLGIEECNIRFPLLAHLFKFHGDDAICLEVIGHDAGFRVNTNSLPIPQKVSVLDELDPHQRDERLFLALASAAEHFSLASNAWGYPGQERSKFFSYSLDKSEAAWDRLKRLRTKMKEPTGNNPWDFTIGESPFQRTIRIAKFFDGCPIGNCGESAKRIFHQLTKQRRCDIFRIAGIRPGEGHEFVVYQGTVLDGWNGPKVFNDIERHLNDFAKMNEEDGTALLQPYNSQTQSIQTVVWNIYPVQEFKNHSKCKYPVLIQMLEEFHAIDNETEIGKMFKALEMIRLIENEMPLYEYVDPAVSDLYQQMLYLTKKVRKNGLKLSEPDANKCCPANTALINLDLASLNQQLNAHGKESMNSLTILHALKASLRANDIRFLKEVVDHKVPICKTHLMNYIHPKPDKAIKLLAAELTVANGALRFTELCSQAVASQEE